MTEANNPFTVNNNVVVKDRFDEIVEKVINDISNSVRHTLGPSGSNTLLFTPSALTQVTPSKDGYKILTTLNYDNPIHQHLHRMIVNVSNALNRNVGDATTSSAVITAALYSELKKAFEEHVVQEHALTPFGFRNILKVISEVLTKQIQQYCVRSAYKSELSSSDIFRKVATISANNDKEIGEIVAKIYDTHTDDLVFIYPELAEASEDDVINEMGFELGGNGIIHPALSTEPDGNTMIYENPRFLLIDGPLTDNDIEAFTRIIDWCMKKNHPLIVLASVFTENVSSAIILNRQSGVEVRGKDGRPTRIPLQIGAIPLDADARAGLKRMNDLKTLLGAHVLPTKQGRLIDLSFMNSDDGFEYTLGSADKVISTQFYTRIIGGHGDPKEISKRRKKLEAELKEKSELNNMSDESVFNYERRIATLNNNIIKISVGGANYNVREYRRLLFEDAIRAVRSTIANGYVLGGNLSISKLISSNYEELVSIVSDKLKIYHSNVSKNNIDSPEVQTALKNIFDGIDDAFRSAYKDVLGNAYGDDSVVEEILEKCFSFDELKIYNILTGQYESMEDSGDNLNLIVPGNTDTEIIKASFALVGLLLSSNKMMTWTPIQGNEVKTQNSQ